MIPLRREPRPPGQVPIAVLSTVSIVLLGASVLGIDLSAVLARGEIRSAPSAVDSDNSTPGSSLPPVTSSERSSVPPMGSTESSLDNAGINDPWPACQRITVRIDSAGAPDEFEDVALEAVQVMATAAGLLVEQGAPVDVDASIEPSDLNLGEIAIGVLPRSVLDPDGEGVAGTTVVMPGLAGRAVITIAADLLDGRPLGRTPGGSVGSVIAHEVGHALGLTHDSDPTQLMYPSVTSQFPEGPADRDLQRLGALAGRGCAIAEVSELDGTGI